MLNTDALSHFLTRNAHPQLYARLIIINTNGSVVAYSTPADSSQVRDQAALVSMLWTEHNNDDSHNPRYSRTAQATSTKPESLQALRIEFGAYNIVAQRVDNELILVLISGKIPGRHGKDLYVEVEKSANEVQDASVEEDSRPINIQRQKAKTLAQYIAKQTKSLNGHDESHP